MKRETIGLFFHDNDFYTLFMRMFETFKYDVDNERVTNENILNFINNSVEHYYNVFHGDKCDERLKTYLKITRDNLFFTWEEYDKIKEKEPDLVVFIMNREVHGGCI